MTLAQFMQGVLQNDEVSEEYSICENQRRIPGEENACHISTKIERRLLLPRSGNYHGNAFHEFSILDNCEPWSLRKAITIQAE